MHRPAVGKRIAAALATASLTGALGLAGSAPALSAGRGAPLAPLHFTVDFSKKTPIPQNPNVGAVFAGNGPAFDATGKQIGKVYETCAVDDIEGLMTMDALCEAYVVFDNGDRLALSTQARIDVNPLDYPYTMEGVVEGGTGAYNGARGDATITAEKPGLYDVVVHFT
jgi:hypothetical protein